MIRIQIYTSLYSNLTLKHLGGPHALKTVLCLLVSLIEYCQTSFGVLVLKMRSAQGPPIHN